MQSMQEQDINAGLQAAISQLAQVLENFLEEDEKNIRASKLLEIINDKDYVTSNEFEDDTKKDIISIVNNMEGKNNFNHIKDLGHLFTGKQERICDSLAKILSGRSECVAVVTFGGSLYISANEVHNIKTGAEIQRNFGIVKNFLKNNLSYESKYNDKMLNTICPHESFRIKFKEAAGIFTEDSYLAACEFVKKHGKALDCDKLKAAKGVGYNAGIVGLIAIDINEQQENLRKVAYYYNTHKIFSEKILKARWIYDSSKEYYGSGGKKYTKVHAEMGALAKVIQGINDNIIQNGSNIYIGISKSCCFHCHYTIEAANKVLKDRGYNIKISYRQAHDLAFNKGENLNTSWAFPVPLENNSLGKNIINEAQKIFSQNPSKTRNVIQTHTSPSDSIETSSDGESNYQEELTKYSNDLSDIIKKSKNFLNVSAPAEQHLKQTQLLLKLLSNRSCKQTLESMINKKDIDVEDVKFKLYNIYSETRSFLTEYIKNLYVCLTGESAHKNIRESFKLIEEEFLPTLESGFKLALSRNPSMQQKVNTSNIKITSKTTPAIVVDRSYSNTTNMHTTDQTPYDTKLTTVSIIGTNQTTKKNQNYDKIQLKLYINNMVTNKRKIFGTNVENITKIVNLVREDSAVSKYFKSKTLGGQIDGNKLYNNLLVQLKKAGHQVKINGILNNILKDKILVGEGLSKLFQNFLQNNESNSLRDLYSSKLDQEKSNSLSAAKLSVQQQIKNTQTTTNTTAIRPSYTSDVIGDFKKLNDAANLFIGQKGGKEIDLREYKAWYITDVLVYLTHLLPRHPDVFRYIFSGASAKQEYYKQIIGLCNLSSNLEKGVYFIAPQSITNENHFIFGMIANQRMLIINPVGLSKQKDFWTEEGFIEKIKQYGKLEKEIIFSPVVLQHDKNGLVSCGPICVELMKHISQLPLVNILKFFSDYDATPNKCDEHLSPLMPPTLKNTQQDYVKTITFLRTQHFKQLTSLHDSIEKQNEILESLLGCAEQMLVFNLPNIPEEKESSYEIPDEVKNSETYKSFWLKKNYIAAIRDGNSKTVGSLLAQEPLLLKAMSFKGYTSLMQAILHEKIEIVNLLIESNKELDLSGGLTLYDNILAFADACKKDNICKIIENKFPNLKTSTPTSHSFTIHKTTNTASIVNENYDKPHGKKHNYSSGKREREYISTSPQPIKKIKVGSHNHTTTTPKVLTTAPPAMTLFKRDLQNQPNLHTLAITSTNKKPVPKSAPTKINKNDSKFK